MKKKKITNEKKRHFKCFWIHLIGNTNKIRDPEYTEHWWEMVAKSKVVIKIGFCCVRSRFVVVCRWHKLNDYLLFDGVFYENHHSFDEFSQLKRTNTLIQVPESQTFIGQLLWILRFKH